MSTPLKVPHNVIIAQWVDQAAADPVRHRERQVTEILLHAIGITPELRKTLVLKGGILMSLAHGSYRQTGDVDFTAVVDPQPYASLLRSQLDAALARAAAGLGYVDMALAVQRFEYLPRADGFETFQAPALKLTIGYARRGSPAERHLKDRRSPHALQVDISFNEQVVHAAELQIDGAEVTIRAYDVAEIIAEKLRALLQQPLRNRSRRQDVFDIDWLVRQYAPDKTQQSAILHSLCAKSEDRDVVITPESLEQPAVRERAQREWNTLKMEIGAALPPFDEAFARVNAFYRTLPWPSRPSD